MGALSGERKRVRCNACWPLSPAPSGHPTSGRIGTIIGPRVECDGSAWGGLAHSIDDDFKYCKAFGWQTHAGSDDNTIIGLRRQLPLHCRPGALIRPDVGNLPLPPPVNELLERNRNTGADLFNRHARWQSGVRKINRLWVVAEQQNPRHETLLVA